MVKLVELVGLRITAMVITGVEVKHIVLEVAHKSTARFIMNQIFRFLLFDGNE